MELLHAGAQALGISLSPADIDRFERYYALLVEANRTVNLTRITAYDDVQVLHFLDSLSCWPALRDLADRPGGLRAIDVGAGAGFPGVPLKIAFPWIRLTLLDSLRKRTAFLEHLVGELGLGDVEVVSARAEDAARLPRHRDAYDAALARALAPLPVLLELCLPFLRVGGRLVAHRRGDLVGELREASAALDALGGASPGIVAVDLPGLRDGRAIVTVEKAAPTPGQFPRRAGLPGRRPIAQHSR
jgi:16S rRNA (guanine527-N7)-methyltransferase